MRRADQKILSDKLCDCGCGEFTLLAPQTSKRRGWVVDEPLRFVHGHASLVRRSTHAVEDRGYESPCWVWKGPKYPAGYGKVSHRGCTWLAHRLYYVERVGEIPPGLEIDHLCFQRDCVNPTHLEAVTTQTNSDRKWARYEQD